VLCVRGNGIIHRAHKAIQGDECRPLRSSWLRFPWLTPIRNSFELRCLYRRSYFGPRACGGGITNVIEVALRLQLSPLMLRSILFRQMPQHRELRFALCGVPLRLHPAALRRLFLCCAGCSRAFLAAAAAAASADFLRLRVVLLSILCRVLARLSLWWVCQNLRSVSAESH